MKEETTPDTRQLREVLAYMAEVVAAQTGVKALSASRRKILDEAVDQMREAALFGSCPWQHGKPFFSRSLKRLERELAARVELSIQENEK